VAKRFHSLSGFFLGLFFFFHLYQNALILTEDGSTHFNETYQFWNGSFFFLFFKIIFLYIPFFYHAGFGLYSLLTTRINLTQYPAQANIRFSLQKLTGVVSLVFIFYHILTTKWIFAGDVDVQALEQLLVHPVVFVFYIVGMICASFYFSNGLWSFLITWGITVSKKSQKISLIFCSAFFVWSLIVQSLVLIKFNL